MMLDSCRDKFFVIKYGGTAMSDDRLKGGIIEDLMSLRNAGIRTIVVHGGGNEITSTAQKLNLKTTFIDGQRYTDAAMISVVQMVLAGKINKNLVADFNRHGLNAIGLSGIDCNLLRVQRYSENGKDLGYVGTVTGVNTSLLAMLTEQGVLPVIAPLGTDGKGQVYNINADNAAAAIAEQLQAEKLVYISDIDGVVINGNIIKQLDFNLAATFIERGEIHGGMIPKVHSAFRAVNGSVGSVLLVSGRIRNPITKHIIGNQSSGTEFVRELP